ncbi:Probable phosphotransferase enzyme IIB component M6_Spy0801 [Raoultella ornithinolytica]|nr:Probable phosphotransferase enzyme IIB component M6_Spy0801 [Raoultella ornithinolytica]
MSTPNILLTRIDNRLVHGQVGVTWTSTIGANLLIVVDDEVANDDIQQKLMGMTADTYGFGIRFFSIEKTIAIISKAAPHQKIFLICRYSGYRQKTDRRRRAIKRCQCRKYAFL